MDISWKSFVDAAENESVEGNPAASRYETGRAGLVALREAHLRLRYGGIGDLAPSVGRLWSRLPSPQEPQEVQGAQRPRLRRQTAHNPLQIIRAPYYLYYIILETGSLELSLDELVKCQGRMPTETTAHPAMQESVRGLPEEVVTWRAARAAATAASFSSSPSSEP